MIRTTVVRSFRSTPADSRRSRAGPIAAHGAAGDSATSVRHDFDPGVVVLREDVLPRLAKEKVAGHLGNVFFGFRPGPLRGNSSRARREPHLPQHSHAVRPTAIGEYEIDRVGKGDTMHDDLLIRCFTERGKQRRVALRPDPAPVASSCPSPIDSERLDPGKGARRLGRSRVDSTAESPEQVRGKWIGAAEQRRLEHTGSDSGHDLAVAAGGGRYPVTRVGATA